MKIKLPIVKLEEKYSLYISSMKATIVEISS